MTAKLRDPVDETINPQAEAEELQKAVSVESLSVEDFQAVAESAAKRAHPFDGYPLGKDKDIKLGTYVVGLEDRENKGKVRDLITKTTYIVALNPAKYVAQDQSGKGVSYRREDGTDGVHDIPTIHSRVVRDGRGKSVDVVFDRILKTKNGDLRFAIVADHLSRSQLIFRVEPKTGGIQVNRDYLLLDSDQVGRLRGVFTGFYQQQTAAERAAKRFDEEPESKRE